MIISGVGRRGTAFSFWERESPLAYPRQAGLDFWVLPSAVGVRSLPSTVLRAVPGPVYGQNFDVRRYLADGHGVKGTILFQQFFSSDRIEYPTLTRFSQLDRPRAVISPLLTFRIIRRTNPCETMAWPHIVVAWPISVSGSFSVLPSTPSEYSKAWRTIGLLAAGKQRLKKTGRRDRDADLTFLQLPQHGHVACVGEHRLYARTYTFVHFLGVPDELVAQSSSTSISGIMFPGDRRNCCTFGLNLPYRCRAGMACIGKSPLRLSMVPFLCSVCVMAYVSLASGRPRPVFSFPLGERGQSSNFMIVITGMDPSRLKREIRAVVKPPDLA